jgi:hypothetical protein
MKINTRTYVYSCIPVLQDGIDAHELMLLKALVQKKMTTHTIITNFIISYAIVVNERTAS